MIQIISTIDLFILQGK